MDSLIGDGAMMEDAPPEGVAVPLDLREIASFGPNPGDLRMILGVPPSDPGAKPRPLVVALHGCTQTAAGYARGAGWADLAIARDFILLLPEQRASNNRQTCFSWFEPGDTRRGDGEVESIRGMIAAAIAEHGADPRRVYVTGLSAGGAMTGAMLAAYPELFAGGAIIAGLPYGSASGVGEAFEAMYTGRIKEARAWGDLVRAASPPDRQSEWPCVSVWHGTGDTVVKPINAGELVKQWTNVHGLGASVPAEDHIGTTVRRVWRNAAKQPAVIEYSIPGLGHGVPVADKVPAAPFFLPANLSSSERICNDWGLARASKTSPLLSLLGFAR